MPKDVGSVPVFDTVWIAVLTVTAVVAFSTGMNANTPATITVPNNIAEMAIVFIDLAIVWPYISMRMIARVIITCNKHVLFTRFGKITFVCSC